MKSLLKIILWTGLLCPFHSAKSQESKIAQSLTTSASVFESDFKAMKSTDTREGIYLTMKPEETRKIIKNKPQYLNISIPAPNGIELWQLDLTINDLLASDFMVKTSDGSTVSKEQLTAQAAWYHGTIAGKDKSFAAISFFNGEVMGVLNDGYYNYDLGKIKDGKLGEHALFESGKIMKALPFTCSAEESGKQETPSDKSANYGCRKVFTNYLECDYRMFTDFGSNTTNTANYVTGVFNVVAQLYNNEHIVAQISQIFVWTTSDPYVSITSASTFLTNFRNNRTTVNGDLAHLLTTRPLGAGGVAYLDGLCGSSKHAFSNISTWYNQLPAYSFTTMVITHEIGHNLGANHTQSCLWPNGPIDNCYPVEGTCAPGPAPVNGGTIMSYCHLTSNGVNFSHGFGPIPGDRIRSRTLAASCLNYAAGSVTLPVGCIPTTSSPNNGFSIGARRVRLNGMDNSSAAANKGVYEDFTCSFGTTLNASTTYNLIVNTEGPNNQNVRTYIDYNGNNVFESNELIMSLNGTSNPAQFSVNFTVPTSAVRNTPIRMRVVVDYFTNSNPQPCGNLTYGQAEDYRIIIPGTGVNYGTLVSGNQTLCNPASPANIAFSTAPSGAAGFSYQWYFRDGIQTAPTGSSTTNWTLISGATAINYTPPSGLTTSRSYACIVTPTGGTANWAAGVRQVTVRAVVNFGTLASGNQTFTGSGDPSAITFGTAPSGGSGSFTYQWYSRAGIQTAPTGTTIPSGWTAISGATSASYDPPVQSSSISYAVRVDPTGSPDCGAATWAAGVRQITIDAVVISYGTIASGNQTLCNPASPANIAFSTAPSGAAGFSYQWYFRNGIQTAPTGSSTTNWTLISGATANNYTPPSGLTTSRSYACMVTPTGGTANWAAGVRQVTINAEANCGTSIEETCTTFLRNIVKPTNQVTAIGTTSPANEDATKAIDNNVNTKYLNFQGANSGLTINTDTLVIVRGLELVSANDVPSRDPSSYQLSGSLDGVTYTLISSGSVAPFTNRLQAQEIAFTNTIAYKYYRLIFPTVVGASCVNCSVMQISEVRLMACVPPAVAAAQPCTGMADVTLAGDLVEIVNGSRSDSRNPPSGEEPFRAIDDQFAKYLNFTGQGSGFTVTVARSHKPVVKLSITSGNDAPERDPASYRLQGWNGVKWISISEGDIPLFTARRQRVELPEFANTQSYSKYRVIFPTLRGTSFMQVTEVELLACTSANSGLNSLSGANTGNQKSNETSMNDVLAIGNQFVSTPTFTIFPNPGAGVYTLKTTGFENRIEIQIYNMHGQLLKTQEIETALHESKLDLSDQPAGTYLIMLKNKHSSKPLKLIKQ